MAGKHAAQRTTEEWAVWAKAEGMHHINKDNNGKEEPGKVCVDFIRIFFPLLTNSAGLLHVVSEVDWSEQ